MIIINQYIERKTSIKLLIFIFISGSKILIYSKFYKMKKYKKNFQLGQWPYYIFIILKRHFEKKKRLVFCILYMYIAKFFIFI